eukprot:2387184-Prymnesium_polylepis.1
MTNVHGTKATAATAFGRSMCGSDLGVKVTWVVRAALSGAGAQAAPATARAVSIPRQNIIIPVRTWDTWG